MTAHNEVHYYQKAIDLNVKGYILKPILVEKLIKLIAEILEEKKINDTKNDKLKYLEDANNKLIDIGYKISSEENYDNVLETILLGAKELSNADGGTLYIHNKQNKTLDFKIAINSTLAMHLGGSGDKMFLPPLNIYDENKNINIKNVSVVCATQNKLVNIQDIYTSTTYDFSGAKNFDIVNNYKSTSMLVIPMVDREKELVGVIQLINKTIDGTIISFNKDDEKLITSMASQATMTLQNNQLVKDLENLLYSLVKSIGSALGEKSSYTAKHVDNVASLSEIIAKGINKNQTIFKDKKFSSDELEEIKLASWLHDIGKITTPEYVVDKATRLETIYDRIKEIETKFEVLKRDIEISYLKNEIDEITKKEQILQIEDDIKFIYKINSGDEFMTDGYLKRLEDISSRNSVIVNNIERKLITENEFYNLSIKKGTLTNEERDVINNHVIVSYNMLKELPFPKKFRNVAKLAGSHHKTVDGKGYGHKDIINDEMTIADKILAVADIFEALSAHDRPYRGPNKLSQIAKILMFMVKDKHLDKDIVRVFLEEKMYKSYIDENFLPDQIDEINIDFDEIDYKD